MVSISDIWKFFSTVDRLLGLEEKHGRAIEEIPAKLSRLSDRVLLLEERERRSEESAKAAAAGAGLKEASGHLAGLSLRVGRLEARIEKTLVVEALPIEVALLTNATPPKAIEGPNRGEARLAVQRDG